MKKAKSPNKSFDKYYYYSAAVQSPKSECEFFAKTYKSINKKLPETMREDFCGTFQICCEWTKLNKNFKAIGVDLSEEPINYGKEHYLKNLKKDDFNRVKILKKDVRSNDLPSTDIVCALNFSYFCFKERKELLKYFKSVHNSLNQKGLLILDCFGGSDCYEPNEEETEHDEEKFSYFWDQDTFNPINNHANFHIHFKRQGEKKRKRVFSYDWRMWSLAELKDILDEAGFSSSKVYWEKDDDDGGGNGEFYPTEVGESCESWVVYIVAKK